VDHDLWKFGVIVAGSIMVLLFALAVGLMSLGVALWLL